MSSEPSKKAVELRQAVQQAADDLGSASQREHVTAMERAEVRLAEASAALDAHIADLERRVAEAEAHADAMREWAAGWILRARETYCYREGWEEGMSAEECSEALTDVLANLGCDAGTENPEQVKEAARLLALDLPHAPPTRKGA